MRLTCTIAAFALAATFCAAQTTGVAGVNDFTVNNNGAGGVSPVGTQLTGSIGMDVSCAPNAVIVPLDGTSTPGAFNIDGTHQLDLFPFNITLDPFTTYGGIPGTFFLTADSGGSWTMSWQITGTPALAQQMGVLDAGFPIGVGTTQSHDYTYLTPLCNGSNIGALSDDGSVNYVFLNGSFVFYGVTYTDANVNMNGNITFGAADGDFTSSEAEMLANAPRVAPAWSDWTPSDLNQGDVQVNEAANDVCFEWFNVRHFGGACTNAGDSNTFAAQLNYNSGIVGLRYGFLSLCFGLTDQVAGISPGGGLSAANNVDLTAPGTAVGIMDAVYEDFNQAINGAWDLNNVALLSLVPTGVGIGPYSWI